MTYLEALKKVQKTKASDGFVRLWEEHDDIRETIRVMYENAAIGTRVAAFFNAGAWKETVFRQYLGTWRQV